MLCLSRPGIRRLVPVEGFGQHVVVPELRRRGLLKPMLDACLA